MAAIAINICAAIVKQANKAACEGVERLRWDGVIMDWALGIGDENGFARR
jgi:hypothetical protein